MKKEYNTPEIEIVNFMSENIMLSPSSIALPGDGFADYPNDWEIKFDE